MNPRTLTRPATAIGRLARSALAGAVVLVACGALAPAPALGVSPSGTHPRLGRTQATVSSNWAGYVAVPSAGGASRFSSVTGTWTQPSATCSAGRESYSAVWVGLGGYSERARALEQIGTDADCSRSGSASYSVWYELLPAGPVNLGLKVRPGDQLSASVTVRHHDVLLTIRDLNTGAHFFAAERVSQLETSSAEWIVEAPSACVNGQTCDVLALTDFGEVAFASAAAVARSHAGPVGDPGWSSTALELQQRALTGLSGRASGRLAPSTNLILATPSALSSSGAFSVSWQEQTLQPQQPSAPTLPGSGGPP
jgi:hypothetical protein